jgi:hypothetical protein
VAFTPGKDYDVVIASIDPADTPADGAAEKVRFLDSLGNPGAASSVHFLTGQQASITDLASATGFNYVRIPGPDGKMDQFAHSSVIMIDTPEGRMSKYLFGIDYQPRDVRLQLQSFRRQVHRLRPARDGLGRHGLSLYARGAALSACPQAEDNRQPRINRKAVPSPRLRAMESRA